MNPSPRPDDQSAPKDAATDKAAAPSGIIGGFLDRLKNAATVDNTNLAEAFARAAKRGDVTALQGPLTAGFNPDTPNAAGETALHLAARAEQVAVVEFLLKAGASPHVGIGGDATKTALAEAIHFGKTAVVEILLQHGAYVPEGAGGTSSLLHRACEKNKADIVRALMAAGADTQLLTANKMTPLMAALDAKQNDAVHALLECPRVVASLNQPMPGGEAGATPFHLAVARGDTALITALQRLGAYTNKPRRDGMTPLLLAINRGDASVVAALIVGGADATRAIITPDRMANQIQPAPLMYLAGMRNMNEDARATIAKSLIAAGADVNAVDAATGETVLHQLMQSHNTLPMLRVLMVAGAKLDARNRQGDTVLMAAITAYGMHEMSNLLAAGVDPNQRHGRDGRTALMVAAALGQTDMIKELLKAGANPHLTDSHGQTALFFAGANLRMASLTTPVIEEALRTYKVKPAAKKGPQP